MVKSTGYCSSRGHGFNSQHLHGRSQLSITIVLCYTNILVDTIPIYKKTFSAVASILSPCELAALWDQQLSIFALE